MRDRQRETRKGLKEKEGEKTRGEREKTEVERAASTQNQGCVVPYRAQTASVCHKPSLKSPLYKGGEFELEGRPSCLG